MPHYVEYSFEAESLGTSPQIQFGKIDVLSDSIREKTNGNIGIHML